MPIRLPSRHVAILVICCALGLTGGPPSSAHAQPTGRRVSVPEGLGRVSNDSIGTLLLQSKRSNDSVIAVLRAQLDAAMRADDRLLDTVHWTLGTVAGVALLLMGFNWFSSQRNYDRDRHALQQELTAWLRTEVASREGQLTEKVDAAIKTVAKSGDDLRGDMGKRIESSVRQLVDGRLRELGDRVVELEMAREEDKAAAERDPSMRLYRHLKVLELALTYENHWTAEHLIEKALEAIQESIKGGAKPDVSDTAIMMELLDRLPTRFKPEAEHLRALVRTSRLT
jgi:hypothetical protein